MASNINVNSSLVNTMANAITAEVDGGGGVGKISIRYGSQPASPDVAASGAEIASVAFSAVSFSTADPGSGNSIGEIVANDFTADTGIAGASTAATWARIYDGDSIDAGAIDVSVATSGADINFSGLANTVFAEGATLDITSLSITVEDGVA